MMEYEAEPIRGLPGNLPEGERILWQGAPEWRVFTRSALFGRWIAGYFALLALWSIANGGFGGALASVAAGFATCGLLIGFAMLVEKTTVYTITNRRVVLRIGVALNKCINLPLKLIGSADLRPLGGDHGNIALTTTERHGLGYLMLWPHARPLRFSKPQPMLRALPNAQEVAQVLADACAMVARTQPNEELAIPRGIEGAVA
ncbi:MAG: photosynthetic complex putative assembly protein PuhB [Proteobacteria bacterium]|nr:photosynthetic complex putative assembly protein PuhB [Pseudomonadota bacterium]MDA0914891.1 photosynthetic complex putative assembly protein PuhB [Pseudomonadota bacterium]MDA1032168.1 photosynthetic complex putative assembly protein PuhB [Pseudomonadota bacterium]